MADFNYTIRTSSVQLLLDWNGEPYPSSPAHTAVMLVNSLYRATDQGRLFPVQLTTIVFVSLIIIFVVTSMN